MPSHSYSFTDFMTCENSMIHSAHPHFFLRYFSKFTIIVLLCFLQFFFGFCPAPGGAVSTSFASLPKPILSPYYLYFGNPATSKLADAFDTLGLRAATVGFATAQHGSVSYHMPPKLRRWADPSQSVTSRMTSIASFLISRHSFKRVLWPLPAS